MLQFITKLFSFDSGPCKACLVGMQNDMTCFCYTTQLFILFTNMALNCLQVGFGMLTVGRAIFDWLYFDYIVVCRL